MYQNKGLLMYSLNRFFNSKERVMTVVDIVNGNSGISLRLIDWFITNYARKNNVLYTKETSDGPVCINFYLSYRSQLKTFSKQQFDPFRRYERVDFEYEGIKLETTVGQLNFFRWAIENEILGYIARNKKAIEASMNSAPPLARACERAPVTKRVSVPVASFHKCKTVVTFD